MRTGYVRLETGDGRVLGSAILLAPGDQALSAAHNLYGQNLVLRRPDGAFAVARAGAVDERHDLALLCLSQPMAGQARLRAAAWPPPRANLHDQFPLLALGSGVQAQPRLALGSFRPSQDTAARPGVPSAVTLDLQVAPGYSGGPVLSARGQLLGMVTAYAPASKRTKMVPAAWLKAFVERHPRACD